MSSFEKNHTIPINETLCASGLQRTDNSFIKLLGFVVIKKYTKLDDIFAVFILRSKALNILLNLLTLLHRYHSHSVPEYNAYRYNVSWSGLLSSLV